MIQRRTALGLFGAALAARGAAAQGFPSRPVRILIPYPPGGGTDALVRPFSERFRQRLGQPIVIENRGGAATNIGMEAAARSAPDGHTLIVNADNVAYFPFLYRSLPYDLFRDFAPVGYMAETPLVIAVNPAVPAATLQEFVALAKASPDRFSFATPPSAPRTISASSSSRAKRASAWCRRSIAAAGRRRTTSSRAMSIWACSAWAASAGISRPAR